MLTFFFTKHRQPRSEAKPSPSAFPNLFSKFKSSKPKREDPPKFSLLESPSSTYEEKFLPLAEHRYQIFFPTNKETARRGPARHTRVVLAPPATPTVPTARPTPPPRDATAAAAAPPLRRRSNQKPHRPLPRPPGATASKRSSGRKFSAAPRRSSKEPGKIDRLSPLCFALLDWRTPLTTGPEVRMYPRPLPRVPVQRNTKRIVGRV